MDERASGRVYGRAQPPQPASGPPATPVSGAPLSGVPLSGVPLSGVPVSGVPVSGGPPPSGPTSSGPTSSGPTSGAPVARAVAAVPPPPPAPPPVAPAPVAPPPVVPPRSYSPRVYGTPGAGRTIGWDRVRRVFGDRLAGRPWLLPTALGLLAAAVLAGCVFGGLALLPDGQGGQRRSGLPGVLDQPSGAPVTDDPTLTPPPEESSAPTRQEVPPVAALRGTQPAGCLQVGHDEGARAKRVECSDSGRQRWRLESAGAGAYLLVNDDSGNCLDIDHRRTDDGAAVQSWDCNNGTNQQWRVSWRGPDTFTLVSVNSGKCLSGADELTQETCRGDDAQLWAFAT